MAEPQILKAVEAVLAQSKEHPRKFKETLDLAINLRNVDLSAPKNRVEEEIPLPHGRGKPIKVGLFASGDLAIKARAYVDLVVTPDQIGELARDAKRFKKIVNETTYFLAEAPLMPTIGKTLGAVLGPRGKMPRPVPPAGDPKPLIENLRRTVRLRSKDRRTFHTIVGSQDQDARQIAENVELVLKRLEAKLEQGRHNIQSIYLKSTMGTAQRVI